MAKDLWTHTPSDVLRFRSGSKISDLDTDSSPGFSGKRDDAEKITAEREEQFAELQEMLYANAREGDHRAVLLVGDAPYHGRFGFSAEKTGALRLPGFCDPRRVLALELVPGALGGARGLVAASGPPKPAALITGLRPRADRTTAHAA